MMDTPLPKNIVDAPNGTIILGTGDFVVLHLQFRVGDDNTIVKDWEALGTLEAITLPWAPWDGITAYADVAASLRSVQSPPADKSGPADAGLLRVPFDQHAVHSYFADFIEHGEDAYIRSHFGDARGDMVRGTDAAMNSMTLEVLRRIEQAGNLDILVERLRETGMGELADQLE